MTHNRRDFLKIAAGIGLGALLPLPRRSALAESGPYAGPWLVSLHAGGAWDPLFLCDPRADATLNRVSTDIGQTGPIRWSAAPADPASLELEAAHHEAYAAELLSNEAFFTRYGNRLTVLNGIDTSTNNHETGTRVMWSGRASEGYPSIGALHAATRGVDRTLAYISSGGYDVTAGVVPLTRIAGASSLRKLASPDRLDPNNPESDTYHAEHAWQRIRAAQDARLQRLARDERLPVVRRSVGELILARANASDLDRLVLPETLVDLPGYQLDDLQSVMQQVQLSMAAFQAGIAVSTSLVLGGFDTHGNHDRDQRRQLAKLLRAVDFVWKEAEARGIADRLIVLVGSDFGRGPTYNGTERSAGKDHWPITSMMVMGAGIEGGRVIGGTSEGQRPLTLDPSTLQPSATGVRLTPEAIHRALRRVLGIAQGEPARRFEISARDIALFG